MSFSNMWFKKIIKIRLAVNYFRKYSHIQTLQNILTLKCIMSQNGQTHFKNLAANTILGHYALKGSLIS